MSATSSDPESSEVAPRNRAGAMTVAMRAAEAGVSSRSRVLRIGVIHEGRIVEERVQKSRKSVFVGSAENNDVVVASQASPHRLQLFQVIGNDYILNFTESMSGRVTLAAGVQELQHLRASGAARNAGTHWQVKLNDASRGKISFGGVTLLFQFVPQPVAQPRPQLPAAARGAFAKNIDWTYTAFAMFSFMVHFGFVVYLESADWAPDATLNQVPDDVARMIFSEPPPPDAPEIEPEMSEVADTAEASSPESARPEAPPQARPRASEDTAPAPAPSEDRAARIAEAATAQAEQLLLGAFGSSADAAIQDVLAGGAVTGDAASVLEQAAGVTNATAAAGSVLRLRDGGGRDSGEGREIGTLAVAGGNHTADAQHEGAAVQEAQVHGRMEFRDDDIESNGSEFDVDVVVRMIRMRMGAIRACYEIELRRTPTLAGRVLVAFAVQPTGSVSGVHAVENSTGSDALAACATNTVRRFRFPTGPTGGNAQFQFPFVFSPQT